MGKLRYSGGSGKYGKITRRELLFLLKDVKIPNKSKMTRFQLIELLERVSI